MQNKTTKPLFIFSTFLYLFASTILPTYAAIQYSYDADGNMSSDGSKCYTYNDENQLSQVKDCATGQIIAQYVYDYQGNRLIKKNYVNGTLNNTVYSPSDEFETKKLAATGAIENTTYYFVNGQQVAKKNPDGSKVFIHNDHLGSSSVVTNATGTKVEETKYDPWGEVKSGGTKTKFQYTGQEKDIESGLNYYNFRYYNSHIRRFSQPDDIIPNPYDPQSLNRYSYVNNNPLRYTDPSGHNPMLLGLGVFVAYMAAMFMPAILPHHATTSHQASKSVVTASRNLFSSASTATANASKAVSAVFNKSATNTVSTNKPSNSNSQKTPNINPFHGNDLRNTAITTGYTLRDKISGAIQKIGETMYPATRYSERWLKNNGLVFQEETTGTKFDMHIWEHEKLGSYLFDNLALPALNKSLH